MSTIADNPQTDPEYIRNLLSPYIDGEVTAEERVQVEAALAGSPEMQRELETLEQTVFLLNHLPAMSAPRPFTLSEADVQPSRPIKKRPSWLSGWFGGLAVAAAAALCVAVFFFNLADRSSMPQANVAMAPAIEEAEAPAESGEVSPGGVEMAAEAAPTVEEPMQSAAVEAETAEESVAAEDTATTQRSAAEAANSAAAPAGGAVGETELAPPASPQSSTEAFAVEEQAAAEQPAEPGMMDQAAKAPADQSEDQMSAQTAVTEVEEALPAEPAPEPVPAEEGAEAAPVSPPAAPAVESLESDEAQPLDLEMAKETGAEPTDQPQAAKSTLATPPPTPTAAVARANPEPTVAVAPTPLSPAVEISAPDILPWLIAGSLMSALTIAGLVFLFARRKR